MPDAWQVTLAAENTEYVSLMRGVELVMSDPGSRDLPISRIFTHDMFLELRQELADQVHNHPESLECSYSHPMSASAPLPRAPLHRVACGVERADALRRAQDMEGLDELERVWRGDYMHRRAVSEFLRDKVRPPPSPQTGPLSRASAHRRGV